ncbi:MAG: peptidoglycan-binding protein [Treponema sp.]|nr:peptidoglycan-binding protein [Treponema sp.]
MHKKISAFLALLFFALAFNVFATENNASSQPFSEIYVTRPRIQGPEIRRLQERLAALGFAGLGEIDGLYGPRTADEIYFIKAALGFVDCYIPEDDWRPDDYSIVNAELWDFIFDPENTIFLRAISQIRLLNNDPLTREPEHNPKVTEFKETQLPFIEPDWVPPWGAGSGSKAQREYYYGSGANRISILETIETVFTTSTTERDFSFQNGLQIRQSIYSADSPITEVRFSIP